MARRFQWLSSTGCGRGVAYGPVYWIINTGRTYESLHDELIRRKVPIWPDWAVAIEREIWLVRDRRGVGWFEWNRKCELLHTQLFESVSPVWKLVEDYVVRHTKAQLVEDRRLAARHHRELRRGSRRDCRLHGAAARKLADARRGPQLNLLPLQP